MTDFATGATGRPWVDQVRAALKASKRGNVAPHADYGLFGPGSVTWKVWSYPTSLTVGFQRAVVVEELDPNLVAAVDATQDIYKRPRTRYDRTLRYFATVTFGDSASVARAANVLVKVHSKAVGTDPVVGNQYDANNPDSQLWILLTAWHSILYAYERYGPGRLTPEEEAEYWEACAVAAEFQTCDPASVPRNRDGIRAYFEQMRPQLRGSAIARRAMEHLLNGEVMLPPTPAIVAPVRWVVNQTLRAATIATMPLWMREMGGVHQPRIIDLLVRPLMKLDFMIVARFPRVAVQLLSILSPSTVPIAAPVLYGIPATVPETVTPAQARDRHGYSKPADAHREWREKQIALMQAGEPTSDQGLIESQEILGPLSVGGTA